MGRQRLLYFTKSSAPKVHQNSPFFLFSPHGLRIPFPFRGPRGTCRARGTGRSRRTSRSGRPGGADQPPAGDGRAHGRDRGNGAAPAAVPGGDEVRRLTGGPHRPGHAGPVEDPLPADHLTGAVGLPLDKGHRTAALGAGLPGLGRTDRGTGLGRPDTEHRLCVSAWISFHMASFLRQRAV